MSSVKQKLLQEIDDRINRKKRLREEVAKRKDDIDVYVLSLMDEIDYMMVKTVNTSLNEILIPNYVKSLEAYIRTLDKDASVQVSWHKNPDTGLCERINGVLIKWSLQYQVQNNCEPERYVDTANMLLK